MPAWLWGTVLQESSWVNTENYCYKMIYKKIQFVDIDKNSIQEGTVVDKYIGFDYYANHRAVSLDYYLVEADNGNLISIKPSHAKRIISEGHSSVLNNGDLVRYSGGLTFTFIGTNPLDKSKSFCINEYGKIDSLPTEKLMKLKNK